MDKIKVLIVDDHAVVRTGLATLLEIRGGIEVVGEADNGETAVRKALKLKPDVVVMDIMMPVKDGVEATREIVAALPDTKVLILTTSTVSADISRALEAGALGAITKSADNATLVSAIRSVAAGKRIVSAAIQELIAGDPPLPEFTERQILILKYVSQGLSNPDIARLLGITVITVKKHMEVIFEKLGAFNRTEAVAIAQRKQLLKM